MRKLCKKIGFVPDKLVTDDLRSYGAAARDLGISHRHERGRWRNNRAENSHQPEFRMHPWGTMGKARERQIILKTDQRTFVLELGLGGKLQVRSSGSDENRTFLEGDDLEVAVRMAAGC
jgi:hypothetical protein